jgi:hypothetical protein
MTYYRTLDSQVFNYLSHSISIRNGSRVFLKSIVTCRPISRQCPKHAHATTEKVLQEVFCMWSAPYPLLGNRSLKHSRTRVKAGSNTSTVTLRVVGGDEKESLKFETVKYGYESQGTRIWERLRWRGPAAYIKDRPVLSSKRAPHKNNTVIVKQ